MLKYDLANITVISRVLIWGDQLISVLNVRISPIILIDGGIGAFLMHRVNHESMVAGEWAKIPLLIIILRDFEYLYMLLHVKKRAEEHSPCPTIIMSLALIVLVFVNEILINTMVIWTMDE